MEGRMKCDLHNDMEIGLHINRELASRKNRAKPIYIIFVLQEFVLWILTFMHVLEIQNFVPNGLYYLDNVYVPIPRPEGCGRTKE